MEKQYNALRSMRQNKTLIFPALGVVACLVVGCASAPPAQDDQASARRSKKAKRSGWATGEVQTDDKAMGMEMSIGYLDERAVDRSIKSHERAMANCFSRAGDARKYLSGQVVMRFVVTGTGQVSDVQLIQNALGSYPVESCLIAVGKQIQFPAPEGRRGTDFEYSMTFQSTGERSVVPWNGEEMAHQLYSISTDLANCGDLRDSDVNVVAYVEPGGSVGSVGFASQNTLDPEVAVCAVALMRKVRVADAPAAHSSVVLRATFPLAMAFERPVGQAGHKLSKHGKRRQ